MTTQGPAGVWNSPVAFEGALWWLTESGELYRWVPGPKPPSRIHGLTPEAGRCPVSLCWMESPAPQGEAAARSQPVLVTRALRRPVILRLHGIREPLPLDIPDAPGDLLGDASRDCCRVDLSGARVSYLTAGADGRRLHVASTDGGPVQSFFVPGDVSAGPITIGDHIVVYSESVLWWVPSAGGTPVSQAFPDGFQPVLDTGRVTSPALPVGALPYWTSPGKLTIAGVSEGLPSILQLSLADPGPRLRVIDLVAAPRDVLLSALPDGTPIASFDGALRVFPRDQREDVDKNESYGAHGPGFYLPPLLAGVTRNQLGVYDARLGAYAMHDYKEIPDYQQGYGFYWVGGQLVLAWRDQDSALRLMAWTGGKA